MRSDLAAEYHAEKTCPVTSGIFLRIVAEANYEQFAKNEISLKEITPFWRIITPKSKLALKLTFGTEFLIEKRKEEGLSMD